MPRPAPQCTRRDRTPVRPAARHRRRGARRAAVDRRCRRVGAGGRVRHAAVRLRRGAPARPLCRGAQGVRRWRRHLRDQGVPVPGDGPPRARRRAAARRRDRRGARDRSRSRRAGAPARAARQQQVDRRAAPSARGRGRSDHRGLRTTSWTVSRRSSPQVRRRPPCCCASTRASRCTPTNTSRPATWTRSSGSRSRPGRPTTRSLRAAFQRCGRPRRPAPAHRQPGVQRRELPRGSALRGALRASARPR